MKKLLVLGTIVLSASMMGAEVDNLEARFKGLEQVSLIINRCKGGKIGELCDKAIETMGKSDERYFLQGRNNNTGEFIPSEKTILLGEDTEKLK